MKNIKIQTACLSILAMSLLINAQEVLETNISQKINYSNYYLPKYESISYLKTDSLKYTTVDNVNNFWVGTGLGYCYFGPTICLNISYILNSHFFTIKYAKSDEFRILEGFSSNTPYKPRIGIKEYAMFYGRYYRNNLWLLSISAGISYLDGNDRKNIYDNHHYEKLDISTIGFPVEAEAMFEFWSHVGIGIVLYGNLNNNKTFGGGMLRIKIGSF